MDNLFFYKGLFRAWTLFKLRQLETTKSLHWLLEEPLTFESRLDISGPTTPGLTQNLFQAETIQLKHMVHAAGKDFTNVEETAVRLGQRSARHTKTLLDIWGTKLTIDERTIIKNYSEVIRERIGITPHLNFHCVYAKM